MAETPCNDQEGGPHTNRLVSFCRRKAVLMAEAFGVSVLMAEAFRGRVEKKKRKQKMRKWTEK